MNGGFIILLIIFGYHYGMGREFSYSASLSTITLLSYLSLASIFFTYSAINNISKFIAVSLRVGEVLNMDEYKTDNSLDCPDLPDNIRISIKDCNMSWGIEQKDMVMRSENSIQNESQEYVNDIANCESLYHIDLEVPDQHLLAIVGPVGAGKSTLLAGIMNELQILKGSIQTKGKVAYVEQEPFMMSGTILDNILFGNKMDKFKLDKVLRV
jgi:ABC-type multidrug transport system fused ATPase/permease subunit